MTRRQRLAVLALAPLALAACGGPEGEEEPASLAPEDSALAFALVDLHLAEARAEITGEPLDSLRALALDLHGLDSAALDRRLHNATETPEDASALAGAVSDLLSQRTPPPSP